MAQQTEFNGKKLDLPRTKLNDDESRLLLCSALEVREICSATNCKASKLISSGFSQSACTAYEINRSRPIMKPEDLNPNCLIAELIKKLGIKTAKDCVRKMMQQGIIE